MAANIAHSDILSKAEYRYKRLPVPNLRRYTRGMKLRLRDLRKQHGWTQRHVAEKAGMSLSYYTEIELGRKQINARRLDSLARVFGVEPHDLIESEGAPEHAQLLTFVNQLTEEQKKVVIGVARSLAERDDSEK